MLMLVVRSSRVPADEGWQQSVYLDLSYPASFKGADPHPWRSKLTTNRLSQFSPNMGMFHVTKEPSAESPWGFAFGGQGGYDTDGQVPATSQLPGADVLRYVSRLSVSYLAPVGRGLRLTAGLMPSFIGFESMYARDNPNYTRSWIADYSPYFLIGAGGQYTVDDDLSVSMYVLGDYDYLSHVNNHPKFGGQVAWRLSPELTLTQNVFAGPEQPQTELGYWRAFSDTILQWSDEHLLAALVYDVGTERLATSGLQSMWTGSALFTRWRIAGPWSIAVRPELYWDPDGELTGSQQFIRSITGTLEYHHQDGPVSTLVRLEYRYDNSSGPQGGFYGARGTTGTLVPSQSTLFLALMLSYDAH
ncbi:MAG: outer membrane beta-barrel protein [Methylotetracoccus sp.]